MLRQRKNMLRQRKEMAVIKRKEKMIERKKKEKMIERKEKEKDEPKKNIGDECIFNWQTPPEDVMEKILQFADFSVQRRLGQVSKSWRSFIIKTFMHRARRQLPWLILPESPNCKINKYLSFLTFPDNKLYKGRVVKLKFPKQLQGGWVYGSSKSWLININEKGLNSEMCLLNPISGTLYKLPPLRTIPSFKNFVKTEKWKLSGVKEFFPCVKMSCASEGLNNFIVAAVFDDRQTLGLCRPGDEEWSVFPVSNYSLADILFSSGMLYALVSRSEEKDVPPISTLNFAFHDGDHLKLKLVIDKKRYTNGGFHSYWSMLLESTNKEVLVIHQLNDYVLKTQAVHRHCTRRFITYKLDPENNKLDMMQSLGDQVLFYGNDGAFSLPASNLKEIENNCIYYGMNLYRDEDLGWLPKTYMTDEFGVFYLDGERIERPFQGGIEMSVKYQASWFTPSL